MISLKEFKDFDFQKIGIDVRSMRELKGDSWMDAAYLEFKKILMEEIKENARK